MLKILAVDKNVDYTQAPGVKNSLSQHSLKDSGELDFYERNKQRRDKQNPSSIGSCEGWTEVVGRWIQQMKILAVDLDVGYSQGIA